MARLTGVPEGVTIEAGELVFGDVAANATTPSVNTFVIRRNPAQALNLAALTWKITRQGAPVTVTLQDSGTYDHTPSDGNYTGTLTVTEPGEYTAILRVTGTTPAGVAFSRSAGTQFRVTPPLARFTSFTDTTQDGNANGLADQLATTVALDVQTAGRYELALELQASNGNKTEVRIGATLAAGTQTMTLRFPAKRVLGLGANGPYQRRSAKLIAIDLEGRPMADRRDDAGATAAYALSSFDRGPIYLTGPHAATGINANGRPGFETLRVTLSAVTPARFCTWEGSLDDQTAREIDRAHGSGLLTGGNTTLTLNFRGYKIRQRGVNGPYQVRLVTIECQGAYERQAFVFQTQSFTVSSFEQEATTFQLAVTPSTVRLTPGQNGLMRVTTTVTGGFSADINLQVSGLPASVTGAFSYASVFGNRTVDLTLTVPPGVAPGTCPFQITGTGGGQTVTRPASLVVFAQGFDLTLAPAAHTVRAGASATYTMTLTPLNGFTGPVTFAARSLPPTVTATFSPATLTTSGTTTMQLTTSASTTPDSYFFTVAGTKGSLERTVEGVIAVMAPLGGDAPEEGAPGGPYRERSGAAGQQ